MIRDGNASRAIATLAEQRRASLIFVATHGRTGFPRLRSGSTAAALVHDATCPVVMFRPPDLVALDAPNWAHAA